MSDLINLITSAEVKALTGLRSKLDPKKLNPYIPLAERDSLRQEISFDLYREIKEQNDAGTLTADNGFLLDEFIKPYLAFMVVWYSVDFIQWDLSDLGLMVSTDEKAEAADKGEVKAYKANLNNHAQSMLQDIREYILDNRELFPTYNPKKKLGSLTKRAGIIFYDTARSRNKGACTNCQHIGCSCHDEC